MKPKELGGLPYLPEPGMLPAWAEPILAPISEDVLIRFRVLGFRV